MQYARTLEHLQKLGLDRISGVLNQFAAEAAVQEWPYIAFLERLLEEEEVATRLARVVEIRTKLARFPFLKTLDQKDLAPAIHRLQPRRHP